MSDSVSEIYVAVESRQTGPFTREEVEAMLERGEVRPTDLAWKEGIPTWMPLATVLEGKKGPWYQTRTARPGKPPQIVSDEGENDLADPLIRLGANILDLVIAVVVVLPGVILIAIAGTRGELWSYATYFIYGVAAGVIGALCLIAVQIYFLSTQGKTVGKKILGIRIVNAQDGSNPGFIKACLIRSVLVSLIFGIPFIGQTFFFVDSLFIFRADHRCIHDFMAETKVVVG
jgi:uncharacterized RDD family membrane protein YckC